jgi:hypothetical protein
MNLDIKNEIADLIQNGYLEEGLRMLLSENLDDKLTNTITQLNFRLNDLNNKDNIGIVSPENYQLEKNRIAKAAIEILKTDSEIKKPNKKYQIIIVPFVFTFLITLIVVFWKDLRYKELEKAKLVENKNYSVEQIYSAIDNKLEILTNDSVPKNEIMLTLIKSC